MTIRPRKGSLLSRSIRLVAALLAAILALGTVAGVQPVGAVETGSHHGNIVSSKPVSWTPHVLDGYVSAFAEVGNLVIVGGNFTQVRTAASTTEIPRNHIFAVEKGTGVITDFTPALNGEVTSILPTGDGQTVLVGGGFSSVNGDTVRSLTKLNVYTGERVTSFDPPAFNGRIHDMALRNGLLYVMGRFTKVANQPHTSLAAVDPMTGDLDPAVKIEFSEPRRDGALSILSADITPDGSKLIAIGNFTKIDGQPRYQIGMVDLTTSPVSVANWSTGSYGDGCSRSFQSYMRDVEVSPDGSYFVVATTGAYSTQFLCDTAARWETSATGSNLKPSWVDYTGGDTLTAVAVTDTAVYLGGHPRWLNNPFAGDKVGGGAVERPGLGAVDIRNGVPLSWNPGRTRGYGVYGFLATDAGLWIGSDTDRISSYTYKGRMAFMPLAGGTTMPEDFTGTLPAKTYSLGLTQGGFGTRLDRTTERNFTGTGVTGTSTTANGTSTWRNLRGAFMVDNKLYTGWSNKTLKVQSFDGSNFGPQTDVPLQLIADVPASLNWFAVDDVANITGMFYDAGTARLYFTKSGQNRLYYRYFSPESNIVGAERFDSALAAGGVTWSGVRSMFMADGKLYTGDSSGNLTQRNWNSGAGLPTGSGTTVSGPSKGDGQNWSARDAFVYAGEADNIAPVANATSSCDGAACQFDGTTSNDPDGSISSYSWNFGDGTTPGTGAEASHVYAASGTYTVTLTVTDDRGDTDSTQITVNVSVPNVAPIARFTNSCSGLECTFDGTASNDPDGNIVSYAWNFGDGTTGSTAAASHTYAEAGTYTVSLTVTDNSGGTNNKTTGVSVVDPNETATVAFGASDSVNVNSKSPTVTIPASTGVDDVMVLMATVNSLTPTVSGPAGWTLLDSAQDSTASAQTFAWTKKATASDAGSDVGLTATSYTKTSLQVFTYKNASSVSAHAMAFDTESRAERTTPTVNVSTPGSALLSYWADKSSDNNSWSLPAGVTSRDLSVGDGNGRIVSAAADTTSMAVGTAGGLTAASGSVNRRGVVWSIVIAPRAGAGNVAPTATFTTNCTELACTFDAGGSVDPDGSVVSYGWDFGDGTIGAGEVATHSYAAAGSFTVGLTVTDDKGASNTTTRGVSVTTGTTAIPQFRAGSESNANTSNPTVDVPSEVQAGDVLVLLATLNSLTPTVSGPDGWTLLDSSADSSTAMQTFAWTKVATAADAGAHVPLASSSYAKTSLQLVAYEGASGVAAHAFSFDSVLHAERTTPTVTVDTPGSALLSYWADKSSSTTLWSLLSDAALRGQSVGDGGGRIVSALADNGSLAAGPAGGITAAADSSSRRAVTWSIVIAP